MRRFFFLSQTQSAFIVSRSLSTCTMRVMVVMLSVDCDNGMCQSVERVLMSFVNTTLLDRARFAYVHLTSTRLATHSWLGTGRSLSRKFLEKPSAHTRGAQIRSFSELDTRAQLPSRIPNSPHGLSRESHGIATSHFAATTFT